MADIFDDTTKFKTEDNVEECDKTAIQKQRPQRQVPGFYNEHQLPKKDLQENTPFWFLETKAVCTPPNS